MARRNGSPDALLAMFSDVVTVYDKTVRAEQKKAAQKAAQKLAKTTRKTAPYNPKGGTPHLRDSIKTKKVRDDIHGTAYTWYVDDPTYRITHLVDKGHKNRNGSQYGGTGFVTKPAKEIGEDYFNTMKKAVKK